MAQCTAKAKRTGERCRAAAIIGRTVCRVHGGMSPAGTDSPSFRHGRHSKHLPKAMADAYAASVADPDVLNLTAELALLDARLGDQLARLEHVDPHALMEAVKECRFLLRAAEGEEEKVQRAADRLAEAAQTLIDEHKAWRDARETLELRRKTVETEVRRRSQNAQMMTAEQMMVGIGYIKSAFDAIVTDPKLRRAFSDKLRVLFAGEAPAPVEATIKEVG